MRTHFFGLIFLSMVLLDCQHSTEPQQNQQSDRGFNSLEKTVVSSGNSFGIKLFAQVNKNEQNNNVFISPFSVSMAFGMALNGANGSTLDSLKSALGDAGISLDEINTSYKNISDLLTNLDTKVVFQNANSIWYRNGFPVLQKFLDDDKNYFDAEVSSLDFSQPGAVSIINSWVNTKTQGKIPTILEQIPSGMLMYLINAIYYKGSWTYQFDLKSTKEAPFTCADGSTVSCQLMSQEATFAYYADANKQVIDLPYGDRSFSMTIILPASGTSIDQYAVTLTQEQWNDMIGKLDSTEVDLYMPKFKLEYQKTLNNELIAMGMGIAFSSHADFTHISQGGGLTISEVLHKTFVEVNEEGTEAAAVTAIGFKTSYAGGPTKRYMYIDHPFICVIREHNSGTILFIGKIVNPNP